MTKLKVLLLNVNRTNWHSGNMIYDMEVVSRACDTIIYGPGWDNYKHCDVNQIIKQMYGDDKPDVIYSYFMPNDIVSNVYMEHYKIPEHLRSFPINLDSVKDVVKVFALSDFWARRQWEYSMGFYESGFSHCFCCFAPPYSNPDDFYSFFDDNVRKKIKFIAMPRCLDDSCFKPYLNYEDKEYDIITAGSMCNFYPFRVWMRNTLNNISTIRSKNYPHSGVNFGHNGFVREQYANAISGSKMLASCGGKYHLFFNKIIEAMACGTGYIGEKPYGHAELGFRDSVNCIFVNSDNFLDKIKFYLNNQDELKNIIENGRKLFLERHTIDKRVNDFQKTIGGIL